MRTIDASEITKEIKRMVIEANFYLPRDVMEALKTAREKDDWKLSQEILDKIIQNADVASTERVPMCQDTGMAVVFVQLGQEVLIQNGFIEDAINEGVRQGYEEGLLRKSVVGDPLNRINTGDNTPAVINYEVVPGDKLHIMVAAKGFGSENMSRLIMLRPSEGLQGVKDFIIETVELAGPNACPPIVVGVGIGGTFEKVTILAKKALMRDLDKYNANPFYANLEKELLTEINALGIGPQGFGGRTTALKVSIEYFPTHIAGLPLAVNINCHATRHKEVTL